MKVTADTDQLDDYDGGKLTLRDWYAHIRDQQNGDRVTALLGAPIAKLIHDHWMDDEAVQRRWKYRNNPPIQ